MRTIQTNEFESEMLLSQKKDESLNKAENLNQTTEAVLTESVPEKEEEKMDIEHANVSLSPALWVIPIIIVINNDSFNQ